MNPRKCCYPLKPLEYDANATSPNATSPNATSPNATSPNATSRLDAAPKRKNQWASRRDKGADCFVGCASRTPCRKTSVSPVPKPKQLVQTRRLNHDDVCFAILHSMLIRIIPSLVSIIPWNPTRPLPFRRPVAPTEGFAGVLAMLPVSLGALLPPLSPPVLPDRDPHGPESRGIGLCRIGELWTLIAGLTARRLKLTGSRSSSRRRL